MIHLFVKFCDHHRLDGGQKFDHRQRRDSEGTTKRQCRCHIPADNSTRQHAQLTTETADEVPDLPTFKGGRSVQPRRAGFARRFTGFAVVFAPVEGPFGESAEPFFSWSSSKPLET